MIINKIKHKLKGHYPFWKYYNEGGDDEYRICSYCEHKQSCLGINPINPTGWIG